MEDEEAAGLARDREKYFGYEIKRPYEPVFRKPGGRWSVRCLWDDAYFDAAKALISGVVEHRYQRALEGVAGVYLFRHYLELALKYVISRSRLIQIGAAGAERAPSEDVKAVIKGHDLIELWRAVQREALPKIADEAWKRWDLEFVEKCVTEFQRVDTPTGTRFRYHADRFEGKAEAALTDDFLEIDYSRLLGQMDHVRDVLRMLDIWFYETHGMIEDYESDLWSDIYP